MPPHVTPTGSYQQLAHLPTTFLLQKGISPAHLALSWASSKWFMGSVIIGATTLEQLKASSRQLLLLILKTGGVAFQQIALTISVSDPSCESASLVLCTVGEH